MKHTVKSTHLSYSAQKHNCMLHYNNTIISLHRSKESSMHMFKYCWIIHDHVDPNICTGKSPKHRGWILGYCREDLAGVRLGLHDLSPNPSVTQL